MRICQVSHNINFNSVDSEFPEFNFIFITIQFKVPHCSFFFSKCCHFCGMVHKFIVSSHRVSAILKPLMVPLHFGFIIRLGLVTSILELPNSLTSSYQLSMHTAKMDSLSVYSSFELSLHKNGWDLNPGYLDLNSTALPLI